MEVELNKKPISPIIIEGFPGFGLLGTIVTEFLIDQLKAELIGTIKVDEAPAIVAVHDGKVVQPIGIFYDKKTVRIGVHPDDTGAAFDGLIDEIALFSEALSEADIQGIMNKGLEATAGINAVSATDKLANVWGNIKIQPIN